MIVIPVAEVLMLIGGIALGLLLGYFVLPSRREAKRLREELDQLRTQHEEYKSGVSQHFVKTAELVGEMTRSYAAVYDHLAGGAQKFCTEVPDQALTFGARPALGDGATFTSTAETVSETPLREATAMETPLREATAMETPLREATAMETPLRETPLRSAAAPPAGSGEGPPIVTKTSASVAGGVEAPGAVDGLTEDDPVHATTGIMSEPGISAEPGELEDGAPSAPKF
jgi:uncharacterized membrane-anchored protein YhcB (DUF1043 family)